MSPSESLVLEAVARRLEADPQHVMPTLRLLVDPDALAEPTDAATLALAQRVNSTRLTGLLTAFRSRGLDTAAVRELLGGVSRQAVAFRVAHRQLLALEIAGRLYFPAWQFGPGGALPRVAEVVSALLAEGRGALAADALMLAPVEEEGGQSAATLLAAGRVEDVLHYVALAGGQS